MTALPDTILAIDPGSAAGIGWAHVAMDGAAISSGVIRIAAGKGPDKRAYLGELESWLMRTIAVCRPTVIAYEHVQRHGGVYAAHLYGMQLAVIQWMAVSWGTKLCPVPVATVKSCLRCRASGAAKRTAMVEAAHALGYTQVTDSNEADAIGVALGALRRKDTWL